MIIVCHVMELTRIVQKIKSINSKLFHRHEQVCPIITSVHHNRLWSQKFLERNKMIGGFRSLLIDLVSYINLPI